MIQIYTEDGLLIVGVTRGNIDRLTGHKPMRVQLSQPVREVLVVYGDDKPSILRELKEAGLDGVENAHMAAAEADPT